MVEFDRIGLLGLAIRGAALLAIVAIVGSMFLSLYVAGAVALLFIAGVVGLVLFQPALYGWTRGGADLGPLPWTQPEPSQPEPVVYVDSTVEAEDWGAEYHYVEPQYLDVLEW